MRKGSLVLTCLAAVLITFKMWLHWFPKNTSPSVYNVEQSLKVRLLYEDYMDLVQVMKDGGFWSRNPEPPTCEQQDRKRNICIDTHCNVQISNEPFDKLLSVLKSTPNINEELLAAFRRHLTPNVSYSDVLFVTAASSNHFLESQALLKNLAEKVFPYVTNYTLVYYDLGLTEGERRQLMKFRGCQVIVFPLSLMPSKLRDLSCYTWKPLIIDAAMFVADKVVWMDASVRYKDATINDLLINLDKRQIVVHADFREPVAYHTQTSMFQYFGEETCSFAHVETVAAAFVSFKNTRLVRELIIEPWVACGLTWNCMCVPDPHSHRRCYLSVRRYNKCHRFDQSALSIILTKLFRGYEQSLHMTSVAHLSRGDTVNYFKELEEHDRQNSRNRQ